MITKLKSLLIFKGKKNGRRIAYQINKNILIKYDNIIVCVKDNAWCI